MTEMLLNAGFLLLHSITDLRWKRVYFLPCCVYAAASVVGHAVRGEDIRGFLAGTLILELVLLGAAKATRESIGYGDCVVVGASSCMIGPGMSVALLTGGLLAAALWSLLLLLGKRADAQTRIPFVPFLLVSQLVLTVLWCAAERAAG